MDPISQGALGAVAAAICADRTNIRKAALVGWAAGMLADADVLISSASDPLLNVEYHRHFSHALIFIPVGALLCAGFFWLITRRRWGLPFKTLYLFSIAGYATAGLLDACTSYGTRLFWPFSDVRVAWSIISIIDPIFTGALLIAIVIGVVKKRPVWLRAGLAFGACYLLLGLVQRERTERLQSQLAEHRGHSAIVQATVKPSIGNLILWRSIYQQGDHFYVDAIRTGFFGESVFYEGVSVPVLPLEELQDGLPPDSKLAGDLERFHHFSNGYLARHPAEPDVVGDLRYAALPQSVKPLWGIRVDRDQVDKHVPFESFREVTKEERSSLMTMLKGQPLAPSGDKPTAPPEPELEPTGSEVVELIARLAYTDEPTRTRAFQKLRRYLDVETEAPEYPDRLTRFHKFAPHACKADHELQTLHILELFAAQEDISSILVIQCLRSEHASVRAAALELAHFSDNRIDETLLAFEPDPATLASYRIALRELETPEAERRLAELEGD